MKSIAVLSACVEITEFNCRRHCTTLWQKFRQSNFSTKLKNSTLIWFDEKYFALQFFFTFCKKYRIFSWNHLEKESEIKQSSLLAFLREIDLKNN